MIKTIAKPLMATALLSCTQFASAIPLSDLFAPGATLMATNGITFSNFAENPLAVGGFDASLVDVTATSDGLDFNANQSIGLTDTTGDTDFSNLWFDYTVTAAANNTILGISMGAELDHSPCNSSLSTSCGLPPAQFGYSIVWKEIFDLSGTSLADIISIEGNESSTGVAPTGPSASVVGTSFVIDDYIAIEVGEFESGNVYGWSQSFTQRPNQVPAPATLTLFALGLLGLGYSRRA